MATHAGDAGLLRREALLSNALRVSCSRDSSAAISRRRLRLSPAQWLAGLPALADVLYLSGHASAALTCELPSGVLLESRVLMPLLSCAALVAVSTITVAGPREWIECQQADGHTRARLYLLPDTDYMAWDSLHAAASSSSVGRCATASPWRPRHAYPLRFHTRALAGLQLLGAESSCALSPLSRQLAGQIARDEATTLMSAALG